jgi:hypothetical protein
MSVPFEPIVPPPSGPPPVDSPPEPDGIPHDEPPLDPAPDEAARFGRRMPALCSASARFRRGGGT